MPESAPTQIGKWLLVAGLGLAAVGLALLLGGKIGLGRLPGDLHWQGKSSSFYFPIVTCLLLSVVASLIANLWLNRR